MRPPKCPSWLGTKSTCGLQSRHQAGLPASAKFVQKKARPESDQVVKKLAAGKRSAKKFKGVRAEKKAGSR
jgi:hypothetical protein